MLKRLLQVLKRPKFVIKRDLVYTGQPRAEEGRVVQGPGPVTERYSVYRIEYLTPWLPFKLFEVPLGEFTVLQAAEQRVKQEREILAYYASMLAESRERYYYYD